MRRELSLLDRLSAKAANDPDVADARREGEDLNLVVQSVRTNLARILNARHGLAEGMPDYGLPALTDLLIAGGDMKLRLQEAIRVAVEKYEPRLRRVRAICQEEEGAARVLTFRVEGVLVSRSGEHRVWYETALSTNGHYEVRG